MLHSDRHCQSASVRPSSPDHALLSRPGVAGEPWYPYALSHAGAIVISDRGIHASKRAALERAVVKVLDPPSDVGSALRTVEST